MHRPLRRAGAQPAAGVPAPILGGLGAGLRFVFQPVVALDGFAVVGFETLARWEHPAHGPISTESSVEVLERDGAGGALAAVALDAAAGLLGSLSEQVWVSVNLSPAQLREPGVVEAVAGAAAKVAAQRLVVEVTEASPLAVDTVDGRPLAGVLGELGELGVRFAVDDFGTGHSTFTSLASFASPPSLKVDRSFTAMLGSDPLGAAVIAAVHALAGRLGVSVVVEGVETAAQLSALVDLGCSFAQGYLFAPGVGAATASRIADVGTLTPGGPHAVSA